METDADRRNMLLALGGSDQIQAGSARIVGLFLKEPIQRDFDEISVSGEIRVLRCLMSDVREFGIEQEARVTIPGDSSAYYVAEIQDEDGLALLSLRKE